MSTRDGPSNAKKPGTGGGLILPSDPTFYELPPPPGSEPDFEARLKTMAAAKERDADEEEEEEYRERISDQPDMEVIPGSVDAAVFLSTPKDAATYDLYRRRTPVERVVLVEPEQGPEAREALLDGLRTLDTRAPIHLETETMEAAPTGHARGIAIVTPETDDRELKDLADAGVIAARFPMLQEEGPLDWRDLSRLAARVHGELGWNVSLLMDGRYLGEVEMMIRDWPGRVLLERFGSFRGPVADRDPGLRALLRLMERDKLWVALAGETRASIDGAPRYRDLSERVRLLADAASERLVWGSDWPHDTRTNAAIDRLNDWLEDDRIRTRILVENPCTLFGFALPAPEHDSEHENESGDITGPGKPDRPGRSAPGGPSR